MTTVAIHTLGCKVNTYDSEAILKLFHDAGYQEVDFKEEADVYVINTCTVTATGDRKSRQMIRRAHKRNPGAIVCAIGCYAQIKPQEIENIEGVSIILGTQHRHHIIDYIEEYKVTGKPIIKVNDVMKKAEFEDMKVDVFTKNTRAFLKIQDGCNNFCTFCIIPYARGKMRSRSKESVLAQSQALVDHGFSEIVLTGIHTAGYGIDLENYSFYDLLVDLTSKVDGLKRLRISSIEMSQVSEEIINLISTSDIIVDHLHIPIQSGNNKILKLMNRKYTTEEFEEKYFALKKKLPDLSITTDVVVGFPGETDEDFNETYNWIKKLHFNQLHVFPYSKREGTPASRMKNQVDEKTKKERVRQLIDLSHLLNREFALSQVGKVLDVLIEEEENHYMIGHASNYLNVRVKLPIESVGHIYKVLIKDVDDVTLIGDVLGEKDQ